MACKTGKKQYSTRRSAEDAKRTVWQKMGRIQNVYICKKCGMYHLTSTT